MLCWEGLVKEDPRSDGNSPESMALSASVYLVQDQAFPLSLRSSADLNSEAALVCQASPVHTQH